MASVIRLESSDGMVFVTKVEYAKCSGTIRTMLEDCGLEDAEDAFVPLPNVSATILRRVLDWAEHHHGDPVEPPPTVDNDDGKVVGGCSGCGVGGDPPRSDDISPWDAEFLKVDQGTLFELILAANYLDIKGLLDATCKTVANMIKGKKPDDIRKQFNIVNDFTVAEEERVSKQNEWCD